MSQRYSDETVRDAGADGMGSSIDPDAADARVHALLTRLLPNVDAAVLVRALDEEASRADRATAAPVARRESEMSPDERVLYRVRLHQALGAGAQMIQHSINNPLAALLAEAQLLELEPLADEHHVAATRIVELARRVVVLVRRMDVAEVLKGR